ncbi:MAG TPA: radical SAM protein [Rhizomicrobium sp.]|nr:radical SAM protein [Rhizomicrobium sp.]
MTKQTETSLDRAQGPTTLRPPPVFKPDRSLGGLSSDTTRANQTAVAPVRVARNMLPAVCDVSVTNVCNAACDFCGFARDKSLVGPRRYIDLEAFTRAMPVLHRNRFRYMTFQGGEPLVHPQIVTLVERATKAGIRCGLITNGWFLARSIDSLVRAGLRRLSISIDSDDIERHEANRGLAGLGVRIKQSIGMAHKRGLRVWASVTVSRLVDYDRLPSTLARLGFDAVSFSYPRRQAFGSTSLVYDEHSALIDMSGEELLAALESIAGMRKKFRVLVPANSLAEVTRFVRGEKQRIPCVGGKKYFYIDWNLNIWRCEAWPEPMGSVLDFDRIRDAEKPCYACMMGCYRHTSAMMHGPIALTDAVQSLLRGNVAASIAALSRKGIGYSLRTLLEQKFLGSEFMVQ